MRGRRPATALAALMVVGGLFTGGVAVADVAAKGTPMSAKDFRKVANNICDQVNSLLSEAADTHFGGLGPDATPDLPTIEAYAADVESIVQQQIDSIAALNPPKKLKKKVKKLLKTAQQELDDFLADPSILLESDPFADAKRLSRKLGLKACAGDATRAGGE